MPIPRGLAGPGIRPADIPTGKQKPMLTLYTTPTCPDCRALKAWLDHQGVSYQERDLLSDQAVMEEAKVRYGVRVAPITVLGEWFTYGTFQKQQPEIRAILQGGH